MGYRKGIDETHKEKGDTDCHRVVDVGSQDRKRKMGLAKVERVWSYGF